MDERTVNRKPIDEFVKANAPDGLLALGAKSRVSGSTIALVRTGYVPKKKVTRELLATALGVSVDFLFPPVPAGTRAS